MVYEVFLLSIFNFQKFPPDRTILTWRSTRYTPGVAYRMLEALLGRILDLGVRGDYTTQSGDFYAGGMTATG